MSGGVRFNIFAFDKTKRAFQSVKNNMNGLKKSFSGLGGMFGGMGKAIVAAFAGAGLKAIVTVTDNIQKLSLKLGVTTQALSELKFVAEQGGSSIDGLELAMKKTAKSVSDASRGLKVQSDALADLGLSWQELIGMPIDQQFELIGNKLGGVESQSDKVRIAMDLMGRAGVDMIAVFSEGADGISRLRQELIDLGGVIDTQSANRMASLNDSWNRFTTAIGGAARQLLTFFAPVMEAVMDTITHVIVFIGKLVKAFRWMEHQLAKGIVRFGEFIGLIEESKADEMVGKIAKQWDEIVGGTKEAGNTVDAYRKKVEEANEALGKMKGKTPGGKSKKSPKDEAGKIEDSIEGIGGTLEDTAEIMKDSFKDAIRSVGDDIGSLEDMAKNAYDRIRQSLLDKAADTLSDAVFGGKNGGGLLDSIFGSSGGGGSGGGTSSLINAGISIASDFFGGFFADGGAFQGGKPIIVGERGPEMIMPRSSGTVIPNHAMSGGRPMNVNINISTPDANSFRASEAQVTAQMAMALDRATRNL